MQIIKPSVQFFGEVPTDYENALKFIEMAGRTCYKSEDKITPTSADGFVRKLIKAGHLAMVEHSNMVVRRRYADPVEAEAAVLLAGKYLSVKYDSPNDVLYVGGNLTAWYQVGERLNWGEIVLSPFIEMFTNIFGMKNNFIDPRLIWHPCPHNEIPKELHRYSAKFICDRGVSHELVRHRPCSFAQESTRYVNYGGKDMEFIEPEGFEGWPIFAKDVFKSACRQAKNAYDCLLADKLSPQQARAVLPNALKTEIVCTADSQEWAHIRKLRTVKAAHPDMVRLMALMPWESFL